MIDWLAAHDGPLFDSCVTDPPYHLSSIVKRFGGAKAGNETFAATNPTKAYASLSRGFMGKQWDGGDVAFRPETWRAVYDALKPGAHLVAFSGTRTYHRMACAIEDAGFEIRDQLQWLYGSGFPKSHDAEKGVDRIFCGCGGRAGSEHKCPSSEQGDEWQGWGTALKPACEPICLARKPLSEKTVAANVLRWGTGASNVDACRVEGEAIQTTNGGVNQIYGDLSYNAGEAWKSHSKGRWPANLLHDGSDEVLAGFPETGEAKASDRGERPAMAFGGGLLPDGGIRGHTDAGGSAARFFYSAKAGPLDRIGSSHATIKPVDLMRWLCRLVTPTGGHILEPFAGSGTTGIAAMVEGFDCTMIELEADHVADIERKLAFLRGEGASRFAEHNAHRAERKSEPMPLFGDAA